MIARSGFTDEDFVARLVETYGTPLYAYDAAAIRRRMATIRAAIPYRPSVVYYSCKANAAVGVVRFLRALGARLDVCSPGDVAVGRAAGFPDHQMSYVGHSMSDSEIDLVARSGVFFTADSLSQIERLGRRCPGRRIGLRINPAVVAGFHPHVQAGARDSKFGVHPEVLDECVNVATRCGLRIVGLHAHLGSDIRESGPHIELMEKLLSLGLVLPDLEFVNIGGGWGTPFSATDSEYDMEAFGGRASELIRSETERRRSTIELRLEPGAYLLMDAGVLITRVTETKPGAPGQDAQTEFVCTDTSYNHLVSAVLYETSRNIRLVGGRGEPARAECSITGNLMQAGDLLARGFPLGTAEPGDVLVIENCGAYASVRAPTFNERPRPAEVLIDGSEVREIRRAETVEDLLSRDLDVSQTSPLVGDFSTDTAR